LGQELITVLSGKTEIIAADIWIIWRKVVNLHPKKWQKVVKQPPKTLRKIGSTGFSVS
jgi:hypothetical protein